MLRKYHSGHHKKCNNFGGCFVVHLLYNCFSRGLNVHFKFQTRRCKLERPWRKEELSSKMLKKYPIGHHYKCNNFGGCFVVHLLHNCFSRGLNVHFEFQIRRCQLERPWREEELISKMLRKYHTGHHKKCNDFGGCFVGHLLYRCLSRGLNVHFTFQIRRC